MKKFICFIALLLTVSIGAAAQKKLGDYIEIGNVPAFVFYLDKSGEHGLAMSIPAFSRGIKKVDKLVKNGQISQEQGDLLNNYFKEHKTNSIGVNKKSKELEPVYAELLNRLSDDGKVNTEQIKVFCSEKDISMQDYFPWEYIAEQHGDGWFVPGDNELKLFAAFYSGGLGKQFGMAPLKFGKRAKELGGNELIEDALTWITFYGLMSSSMHHADCGFRKLSQQFKAMGGKNNWFELFDKSVKAPITCFVHEF